MNVFRFTLLASLCILARAQSTTPDVGSGSPTVLIQQQFEVAYYRAGFANLVAYPPLADVKRLGTNGLVQEFSDAAKTAGVKYALIMPNVSTPVVEGRTSVFQMQPGLYAYFTQVGVNTAGMPTMDTQNCPALALAGNSCQFQLFDKPYALFVFKNAVSNGGTTFATRDPFYTKWSALGGIGALGPAVSAEAAVTSSAGTKATAQYFDRGALYNITSGTSTGRLLGVRAPIYTLYAANNSDQGFLGFPVSEELTLASGHIRQSFEGGAIEYDPANPSNPPVLRTPVANIVLNAPASPVRLKLGDSVSLTAGVYDPSGLALTDRQVLWSTSNGRVVALQPNGAKATVTAVGGGTATISATSEGKTSAAVTFVVTAPCCQIGEGAPAPAIAQAFQDAVTRNRLVLKLPDATSVVHVGAGYVQQFEDVAGNPVLIAVSGQSQTAYVISGKLLTRYLELGGPTGILGFPTSDATSGGRQNFENGVLAGAPPRIVTGDILNKWAQLGYETGAAGSPTGTPSDAVTFRATPVTSQPFQNALLVAAGRPAKVFAVAGLMLAKYQSEGGPTGSLGAPLGDAVTVTGRTRQDFEGGYLDYAPGDGQARITLQPRQPTLVATPNTVLAGTPLRLSLGGFDNGTTVRVSISGQPDFTVTVPNGVYIWDSYIAASTRSGVVTVRAVSVADSTKSAQITYSVRALSDVRLRLTAVRGDTQTGAPGALLPAPLVVALKDDSGNPVPGSPVTFTPSPGAAIVSASQFTDANGQAQATLRLPSNQAVALVVASAGGQELTLSARSAPAAVSNFPVLSQNVPGTLAGGPYRISDRGAMLTAVASILRYYQARGDAPAPNGLADPLLLNQYLTAACVSDTQGVPVCDGYIRVGDSPEPLVNLWRVAGFTGGALDMRADTPNLTRIRDWIAQGVPVLVALELHTGPAPSGSHFVVATGVDARGSILIADPAGTYPSLDDYIGGGALITGIAVWLPRPAQTGGFLVTSNASIRISSAAGTCGTTFEIADANAGRARLLYCDGAASLYAIELNGGTFTALGTPAARSDLFGGGNSFQASQRSGAWIISPLQTTIAPSAILNAADFSPSLAPGSLATIFGAGFPVDPRSISLDFSGLPAKIVAAFPFQLNVEVPPALAPGSATVHVATAAGPAQQDIQIQPVAPALFTLSAGRGAVVNKDGSVNSATNPAQRGTYIAAYATGLGTVVANGPYFSAAIPVTATIGGVPVPILFAGLAPGFTGLYQINIALPSGLAPGLALSLTVQQGNMSSNTALIAVQ